MRKKGQVSLFIILGIIIIITTSIVIIVKNNEIKGIYNEKVKGYINSEIQLTPLKSFVESCIEKIGYDSIVYVGKQGGYYNPPNNSIGNTPYYFINNKSTMPSKITIEKEISKYLDDQLFFCTRNFIDFPELSIIQEPSITKTTILDNKIVFNTKYNLKIFKGDSEYSLNNFNSESNIRLGVIYNSISEIIKDQTNNTDSICISCINNLINKNKIYIQIDNIDDQTMIFTVIDNNPSYEFIFANKYE